MQSVLDWMRAGLFEGMGSMEEDTDRAGVEAAGSGGRRSWNGDDGDIIRAGGGCGGKFGKRQGPKGVERRFLLDFLGFEEGVTVEENGCCHWKEEQKLGAKDL
ncbi:hypothetical protein PPACK8108_LOCUS4266 [Phakopsora pachyrhizi]|uniref:Uncharacterized protein n=1 Tax=Phakopsora pachyrhizi TaxID=170000 RepID=A0AAV0ANC1_PHAPC|nr:hypothetical protein PPACK8108_LOCUS4266 [Phakopsora pachyrhizi]